MERNLHPTYGSEYSDTLTYTSTLKRKHEVGGFFEYPRTLDELEMHRCWDCAQDKTNQKEAYTK
jgi:hypothetical protein